MLPKNIIRVKKLRTSLHDVRKLTLFWFGIFQLLTGTVHSAKEVPIYEVSGVEGGNVHLPCNISIAENSHHEEDNVVLVLWYREDLGTPIYSVDVRGKDFDRAEKWSDDNVLENRAYFEPDLKSSSLVIDRISKKDEAVYRCRVDFKYAQTRNSKVNLTIIVQPKKIVILDQQKIPRTTVIGPYPENSDLLLICQVFGGEPRPSVNWYKNSRLLNNTVINVVEKDSSCYVESIVVIKRLQRSDLHSQLTCEGRNNYIKPALTATVEIDMNFNPLDVRIVAEEQPLTAQRKYDLVCESTGSRPPAKLTWWKNNHRLDKTKDSISQDGNTTTSTLTFIPSKEDKGKYLSCHAENAVISGKKVLETRWKLQIHYIPETKIILGTSLKPDSIKEGMDVYFDCIINAYPSVYKVEWRKNNKALQHNIQKGVIISNQSLVLQSVTRSHAGNYTCIGYNAEGDGISESFYLNVMYAPFCKLNQTRIYGIAKNEVVNITCEVEANPTDLIFRWKFNNSGDSEDLQSRLVNKSGNIVSIVSHTPIQEVDYGTLLCSATNTVGRQRVPCVFHVIAAGKPDSVSNCSVNNVSLNSFSVRCIDGFNGGLPQTFTILVKDEEDSLIMNMIELTPRFMISGLQPGTSYKIFIHSVNAKGNSEPYPLEVVTQGKRTPVVDGNIDEVSTEKHQRHFHVSTTVGIIIATVILLFSIICIIVSIFNVHCCKSSTDSKRHKIRNSNGNLHVSENDKIFPSPIHDTEEAAAVCTTVDFNMDVDDKNPDIIPQATTDIEKHNDYTRKKQHISTIENKYLLNQNFLQYSNTPIGYSEYCTLRTGIVPLQDLCHLNTKTTTIHGDIQYLSSASGTLPRHPWPLYGGSTAGIPSHHQCVYQTLPNMSHQQIQTQISVPPTISEKSLSSTSLTVNKQESTV